MQELKAIEEFAAKAHADQTRKYSPDPYIVHPVRVMEICRSYSSEPSVLGAALLHDVLEDTNVSREDLRSALTPILGDEQAERCLNLVVELTDVYIKEDYPQWNRRIRKEKERERMAQISADAQTVKYADIFDNCREIIKEDPSFAPLFLKECRQLMQVMSKGNPELYDKTMKLLKADQAR